MDNKKVKLDLKAPIELTKRDREESNNPYYRNDYMRDRDRILYSKSFRRLAGKTQVYLVHSNDHLRTRLTHTLEVAQIAKTISSALGLDIDLTEAIALGHDIGHTPFGHAGEQILHEIVTPKKKLDNGQETRILKKSPFDCNAETKDIINESGFKHNWQSVRIAVNLEKIYNDYGLNLTNYTLYGMLRHSGLQHKDYVVNNQKIDYYNYLKDLIKFENNRDAWSFEAFVVEQADEIAQRHHDLEDAIRGNIISTKNIISLLEPFKIYMDKDEEKKYYMLNDLQDETDYFIASLSKLIVNLLVTKLVVTTTIKMNLVIDQNNLSNSNVKEWYINAEENDVKSIVSYDTDGVFTKTLKDFAEDISKRLISSCIIQRMDTKGQYILRKIFKAFYYSPQQLPDNSILSYLLHYKKLGNLNEINGKKKNFGIGFIRNEFSELFERPNEESKFLLMRVICDHISGMTDNYAIDTFSRLYGSRTDIVT